jgi:hypothetical protein
MPARFIPPDHPGGRIVLRSGTVDVGALFPPAGTDQHRYPWVWRLWKADTTSAREGRAKTELAARTGLLGAWRDTLLRMDLKEVGEA